MLGYLLNAAFFISVFSFIDTGLITSPQILLQHFLIILLLPYLIFRYRTIPKYIIAFSVVVTVIGVFHIFFGNNILPLFLKVFIGLMLNTLFFFYFIKYHEYNVEKIFRLYLYGAVFSSCAVILQLIFFKIGFRPGYDVGYLGIRLGIEKGELLPAAFLPEPAHFSAVMCPALFIAVLNIAMRKRYFISFLSSFLIIISILLAKSSTGYIAIFLCFILIAINYRALSILLSSVVLGVISFFLLYYNVPKFQYRFDDSVAVFIQNDISEENLEYNASTLTLYNNLQIASENFKRHPFFGTGLGSHTVAHAKYSQFDPSLWWFDLNKEDANSLFIRMLSETGIFGLVILFIFIFRCFVIRRDGAPDEYWLISNAVVVLIFINLLRQGNYMIYGFPAFILMYYYIFKEYKSQSS